MSKSTQSISCDASNPGQTITVYGDGRVRLHTGGKRKRRTLVYRPKTAMERNAVKQLVERLNLLAASVEGEVCEVCARGRAEAPG